MPVSNLVHKHIGARGRLQLAVVFASLFLAFGYAKARGTFQRLSNEPKDAPIAWGFLGSHFLAFLALVWLSHLPFGGDKVDYVLSAGWFVSMFSRVLSR
jgi:hypothetical protein